MWSLPPSHFKWNLALGHVRKYAYATKAFAFFPPALASSKIVNVGSPLFECFLVLLKFFNGISNNVNLDLSLLFLQVNIHSYVSSFS
jgi:hypothetical protein